MRKDEKSLVMIKPAYGFAREANQEQIKLPQGWEEGEKAEKLKRKRVFYEVKLHDWIVRHDVDGDGLIMKTIL
jgi:hypothetical protein